MLTVKVLVERGSFRDKSQDWGEYDFLALPSPGDRISITREGKVNYLTVLCVHHQPAPAAGGQAPSAHVVAKWTGEE